MAIGKVLMPFGKHAGKPLSAVPTGYLSWALANCRLSSGIRSAIGAELRGRGEPAPVTDTAALPTCPTCPNGGDIAYSWDRDSIGRPVIRRRCRTCGRKLSLAVEMGEAMALANAAEGGETSPRGHTSGKLKNA